MGSRLTETQAEALLAVAADWVSAAAEERAPRLGDAALGSLASLPVGGVFVSLKRGHHLRGCTGGLRERTVRLADALADAAESTVLRDQRFPVVSVGELHRLRLEIWLLHSPHPVTARGEDRVRAVVTGGKHGLIVSRGDQRGLLLPGVAADRGWDSRTFLEQVCVKAGLHPSMWRDDDTQLSTFEGDAFEADLSRWLAPSEAPPAIDRSELTAYFDFCWENIVSLFQGATIQFFRPGVRDAFVSGVLLRLRPPGAVESIQLSHISLRPGVRVQSTLVQLAQAGAQQLAQRGVRLPTLAQVGMGLTIVADPHVLGSADDADLAGFDSVRRGLLVFDRDRQGLAWKPDAAPRELLAQATDLVQARRPGRAATFGVQVFSSDKTVAFSSAPKPVRGPADRAPGVAGSFYPAEPDALAALVDQCLADGARQALPRRRVPAAMVPHAGLRYSGRIAAQVLQSVELPSTILILGPKHTPYGMDWAVAPHQTWRLPGGEIASDFMLARRLCRAIPGLAMDAVAHQREHAIEVELPLLARLAPKSRIIGVALAGGGDWRDAERFAEGLAEVVREMPEPPLLLVSSDMNHFATDIENRRLDAIALDALATLDPKAALATIESHGISMCGVFPAVAVMETLRRLGQLRETIPCGYATSADVSGDPSRVVGYAGMLFA